MAERPAEESTSSAELLAEEIYMDLLVVADASTNAATYSALSTDAFQATFTALIKTRLEARLRQAGADAS